MADMMFCIRYRYTLTSDNILQVSYSEFLYLSRLMAVPLSTIYEGDFTLRQGSDVTQFGWGDMNINRNCTIYGTTESTNSTTGALVVYGGLGLQGTANLQSHLNVLYGLTNLAETHINTDNGATLISGAQGVDVQVGSNIILQSTGGNVNVHGLSVTVQADSSSDDAIQILPQHTNGGILLATKSAGKIALTSGSGGFSTVTSSGTLDLISNNASSSWTVNTVSSGQNLVLDVAGATDSTLALQSSGIASAISLTSTNTAGNITISNALGLGSGSISALAGSGGFHVNTNTGGNVNIVSNGGGVSVVSTTNGPNQDVLIKVTGTSGSSVRTLSDGDVIVQTSHSVGNINIENTIGSFGGISLYSGTLGIALTTQTGGSITANAYSATSLYTNTTLHDNQDLVVSVTGGTDSKVVIESDGVSQQAVLIRTTTNTGGILLDAQGSLSLQSVNAVRIGTTATVPVYIGTPSSVTTIQGDLNVKGVTTQVDSTIVTVSDNIIIVNNTPLGISDGGLGIKRYQNANDSGSGEVVAGTSQEVGLVGTLGNTLTTVNLGVAANGTIDYYNGWWIKITGGTGAGQVRRIADYDETTQIATIVSSADQVSTPVIPVEGMDFATIPDATSTYALYHCYYTYCIWDESEDEFAFVCNPNAPSEQVAQSDYANLHVNNLTASDVTATTINNVPADISIQVTLTNNSSAPVTLVDFPSTYGVYSLMVRPTSTSTRTHAMFNIARSNNAGVTGIAHRILSVRGSNNEQLDIQWPADAKPQILYRAPPGVSGTTDYTIRIQSV
jgi:hypothetical protein